MRITADIIEEELPTETKHNAKVIPSQPSRNFYAALLEEIQKDEQSNSCSVGAAMSPNEFSSCKIQNDGFKDMCSQFSNLNISGEEYSCCNYASFEKIIQDIPVENSIFFENLSFGCSIGYLHELVAEHGRIIQSHIMNDCALLVMESADQAIDATLILNYYNSMRSKLGIQPVPKAVYIGKQGIDAFKNRFCQKSHVFSVNNKMDESKAGSSKGKSEMENPSPWMMEFLLKMKQEIKEEILEELTNLPRIEMQGHSTSHGKGDENQYQGEVVHPGIFCDNCDQLIHGIRYKCGNCTDFDLCQECESLPNIHNKNHIFLKIRFPVSLKLFQKQKWQPFVLPTASELITPGYKSHSPKKLYEAKFVCDETVPDGTVLSPSTRFIKSWRVLNSGKRVWTHSTKLQHIQGSVGLTPASEQVDVPHLRPGEEGIVSVLFTTPAVPGVYRSHWNFCHKSRPFGHIVWCHIVVKDPESEEKPAEVAAETLKLPTKALPSEKEKEVASIAKVLTAVKEEQEKGNMIPRKLAVNSHTATPNTTPFDLTPPKSPDHQAMTELKVVVEDKESIPTLPVGVGELYDPDEEGSVVSLSSSDSDAEFVVIPMPNCFNLTESFASRNISHLSQYLQSETVGEQKDSKQSDPKPTKPQSIVLKPSFGAETVSQETGVPELSSPAQNEGNNSEQKIIISHNVSADGSSSEISIIESGDSSPTGDNAMPEISSIHIAVTSDVDPKSSDVSVSGERRASVQQETPEKEDEADIPGSSATFPKFPVEGITSIYEPASSNTEERTVQVLPEKIVTVPLNVASSVYNATMQMMTNIRRQYSDAQNNQEGNTGTPGNSSTLNPMEQLAEMGFCNRQQNEELLKKHKNDVALVVAELVSMNDNDWYASRHVPPSPPSFD